MSINGFYSTLVTSTGAPVSVPLATSPQFVRVQNLSLYGYTGTSQIPLDVSLQVGSGVTSTVGLATSTTAPGVSQIALSSGGITVGNTAPMQAIGSPITISSVTAANPALVTSTTAHGLQSGDVIWMCACTGMQQIAQMAFTVEVVSSTTFTLPYLDASGFSAPATGGNFVQVSNFGGGFSPFTSTITSIVSSGTQTLVTMAVSQTLQVGQMFKFSIPSYFGGMLQLNQNNGVYSPSNLGGYEVVAYDSTTNTATFNVDSSSMGTFAFPSNAFVITQPAGIIQSAQISTSGTYWGVTANIGMQNVQTNFANLGSSVCGRANDVLLVTYGWLGN